jgi:hypothetical protein
METNVIYTSLRQKYDKVRHRKRKLLRECYELYEEFRNKIEERENENSRRPKKKRRSKKIITGEIYDEMLGRSDLGPERDIAIENMKTSKKIYELFSVIGVNKMENTICQWGSIERCNWNDIEQIKEYFRNRVGV